MNIVIPQAHQGPHTPAHPGLPVLAARVARLLDRHTGQLGRALRTLVWRLSTHPSQLLGRLRYTELSVGYIAKAAGVGRETARVAWHKLRQALGWVSSPLARVRQMGARIRPLIAGGLWGQHLLLTEQVAAAVDRVAADLGLGPEHYGHPTGPEWHTVNGLDTSGRYRMGCCPWHSDTRPSLLLNINQDGISGSGVCLACTDEQGQPLRVYWREHQGTVHARQARSVSTLAPTVLGSGTIHNLTPATPLPGAHLTACLTGRGMRRRASACGDLLGLLAYADKRSQGQAASDRALQDWAAGQDVGQQYASVDPMQPTEWREFTARRGVVRVPTRWEPTAVQWVLADLDGFDCGPVGDDGLAIAGEALERWAQGQPLLSGRVGVIRTSHRGVQVVVELAEARGAPRQWYRTGEARALCAALDGAALVAVRAVGFEGGHADQAVHAAGRLMRRPGWRLDRDGVLYRSRLAYRSAAAPVQPVNRRN